LADSWEGQRLFAVYYYVVEPDLGWCGAEFEVDLGEMQERVEFLAACGECAFVDAEINACAVWV
jgi:hypothetical protein